MARIHITRFFSESPNIVLDKEDLNMQVLVLIVFSKV